MQEPILSVRDLHVKFGLRGRVLHVHSLDPSFSDGIEAGEMVRTLERIDHRCTQREGCAK